MVAAVDRDAKHAQSHHSRVIEETDSNYANIFLIDRSSLAAAFSTPLC